MGKERITLKNIQEFVIYSVFLILIFEKRFTDFNRECAISFDALFRFTDFLSMSCKEPSLYYFSSIVNSKSSTNG